MNLPHIFYILLVIGVPVGLAVFLTRRWKLSWRLWLTGVAAFILAQVAQWLLLVMLPVLDSINLLPSPRLPGWQQLYSVLPLLVVVLCEELVRYSMFHRWLADARTPLGTDPGQAGTVWRAGVLAGAGYAWPGLVLTGLTGLWSFGEMLSVFGAQTIINYMGYLPWYVMLGATLGRLPLHLALSVMVLQVFTRKQPFWLWLAVLYHALADGLSFLVQLQPGLNAAGTEVVMAGFGLLSLLILFALRRGERAEPVLLTTDERDES